MRKGHLAVQILLVAFVLPVALAAAGGGTGPASAGTKEKPAASPAAPGAQTGTEASEADEHAMDLVPLVAEGPAPDIIFIYSGRIRGYVEPCGCPRNPAGGLARRAGYLKLLSGKYPDVPKVLADTGEFAAGFDKAGRLKTSTYLEGLEDLEYGVVGVGDLELEGGLDAWEEVRGKRSFPFVSASFTMRGEPTPYVDPYVIREYRLRSGVQLKVGFIGLTTYNSRFISMSKDGRAVVMRDAVEQAKTYLPEVAAKSDFVVLLANLSPEDLRHVVEAAPGTVNLILAAFADRLSPRELEDIDGVPALYAGDEGRRLGEIRVFFDGTTVRSMSASRIHLTDKYPAAGRYQKLIDGMISRVNEINRLAALEEGGNKAPRPASGAQTSAPPPQQSYAGPTRCAPCHDKAYDIWANSKHARALETLVHANQDFNPECTRCHTTGFGTIEGFQNPNATPQMANVQCEACHGPGSNHVTDTSAAYGNVPPRVCFGCHTRENSPDFSFFKYWSRIKH